MVDKAVYDGGSHHMVIEDPPPFIKDVVAGEDGRTPLVPYGDELEEEVGLFPGNRHIAKFIDDQKIKP